MPAAGDVGRAGHGPAGDGPAGDGRSKAALTTMDAHWRVHTTSIAETIQELSRIWGVVAQRAAASDTPERTRAQHRGDRRVAARLVEPAPDTSLRVRTRTSVLTLIVVADAEETRARATASVRALAGRHPSRAIILAPGDPDGPASFDAHIDAACHVPPRSTTRSAPRRSSPARGRGARTAPVVHGRTAHHPRPAGGPVVAG
ncbi:MAG: hypothetical protein R3C32_14280 [Chloroflexota bacterium]